MSRRPYEDWRTEEESQPGERFEMDAEQWENLEKYHNSIPENQRGGFYMGATYAGNSRGQQGNTGC